MPAEPLVVDAFELLHPIGAGGMGRVWRARHRASGEAVAIKVLSARRAADPAWRRAFEDELRAVASLQHPAVVRVLDCGDLAAPLPDPDGGALPAGSPWLAMELVAGGALDARAVRGWDEVLRLAREVLGALACVHAHGIVHRDLKPGNVLVAGPHDPRARVRLTDFGMAWQRGRGDGPALSGGTPAYMAPEQWRHDARAFGPPTDLYALGGLVWALLCGAPPHASRPTTELARAHQWLPLPPLAPRVPVPEGLADWLGTCLAADPERRFATAADALAALDALGPATAHGAVATARPGVADDGATLDLGEAPVPATRPAPAPPVTRLPVPASPPVTEPGVPWPLVGIGHRLFAFRTVPMAGRRAERARLWGALRAVAEGGGPRMVQILGEAGVGKTRLAHWLGTRAEEVGAARLLAVRQGFAGLLRQVGGHEHDPALVEVAAGAPAGPAADAVAAWLAGLTTARAAVLWIDDAHLAADALAVVTQVLRTSLPVLVVVAARPSALAGRPEEATRLAKLRSETIELGPLDPHDMDLLARELLRMEGDAAGLVIRHAEGSPGFAVALVEDLLRRGALVPGAGGFVLRGDVRVPDDLHALWQGALDRLVPEDALPALEIAATLGTRVEAGVLAHALAVAGVAGASEPPAGLLDARLVRREADGWSFTDPALHASVLRRAEAEGRLPAWHRACAAAVEAAGGAPARLGRHLLAGGEAVRAAPALLVAADDCQQRSEFREAMALLAERDRALDLAGVPDDHPDRGEGQVRQMWIHLALGAPERARQLEARVLAHADDPAWAGVVALGFYVSGLAAWKRTDLALAAERFDEAARRCGALGDTLHEVRAVRARAQVSIYLGDLATADRLSRAALDAFERIGAPAAAHTVVETVAVVRTRLGDLDGAEAAYRRALALCEQTGRRSGMSAALNGLGEVARRRGDLDEAARCYHASDHVLRSVGMDWADTASLNLGLVEIARGRPEEARRWLARAASAARRLGQQRELVMAAALLLACDAAERDWTAFAAHLAEAEPGVASGVLGDPDVRWALEVAEREAREAGEPERAEEARAFAARIGVRGA